MTTEIGPHCSLKASKKLHEDLCRKFKGEMNMYGTIAEQHHGAAYHYGVLSQ